MHDHVCSRRGCDCLRRFKDMLFDFDIVFTNYRGPFGAIMFNSEPPRPRQSPWNEFLVGAASHESSGAHLGHIFDIFPGEDISNSGSGYRM